MGWGGVGDTASYLVCCLISNIALEHKCGEEIDAERVTEGLPRRSQCLTIDGGGACSFEEDELGIGQQRRTQSQLETSNSLLQSTSSTHP